VSGVIAINAVSLLLGTGTTVTLAPIASTYSTPGPVLTQLSATSPYGWDLSCVNDLDPAMIEVGGNTVLAQALSRRLLTPHGTLCDDADYGYDLGQFIGADLSASDIGQIQGNIVKELLKDERVKSCQATVIYSAATSILTATIQVGGASGPFQFVLTISQLAASVVVVGTF
jgi:hypothetical protein